MVKKPPTIEEFDTLYDLPGGCNILAAGKNTPIWKSVTLSNIADYYNTQPEQLTGPAIIQATAAAQLDKL